MYSTTETHNREIQTSLYGQEILKRVFILSKIMQISNGNEMKSRE